MPFAWPVLFKQIGLFSDCFFWRCRWKTYSGHADRAFGGGILSIEMESPKYSIYCMTDIVNEKRVIYKIKNAKGPQRLSTVG
jgi:hypothetical protein